MKNLIFLFCLLTACSNNVTYKSYYVIGQKVQLRGFYSRCTALLAGFDDTTGKYIVRVDCPIYSEYVYFSATEVDFTVL